MRDVSLLILACKQLLDIQNPVEIVYKTKCRGQLKHVAAYCWDTRRKGILKKFRLVINCEEMIRSEYDSNSVIAHEMIHAKMIENETFNPQNHHCKTFQKVARELTKCLEQAKFKLKTPIFNPETDDKG